MIRALPPSFPSGAADGAAPPRARRCGERGELRAPSSPGLSLCARLVSDPPRAAGRERRGAPGPVGTGPALPRRSLGRRRFLGAAAAARPAFGLLSRLCRSGTCYPGDLEGGSQCQGIVRGCFLHPSNGSGSGGALIQPCRSVPAAACSLSQCKPRYLSRGFAPSCSSMGPVGCLPKYLRRRGSRDVPPAPKHGDSNEKDKTKSCLEALQCSLAAFRSGAGCSRGRRCPVTAAAARRDECPLQP